MEKIRIVPEQNKKYFYNYPHSIVLVGAQHNNERNIMPVAWSSSLSYNPFLYGISVGVNRHTHQLLCKGDSFTVNFMDFKEHKIVRSLGRSSGAEMDKIKEFNLSVSPGEKVLAPIVDLAYCTFECAKRSQTLIGDHTLFVGEVVLMHIDKKAVNLENMLNIEEISPLMYLGKDNYVTLDKKSKISLQSLPFHYKKRTP